MLICTFFGHKEISENLTQTLVSAIKDLIENKNVGVFYVGNQGCFDRVATQCLKLLKDVYPFINCYTVLAYIPKATDLCCFNTIYPNVLEKTPPKFALDKRNRWMIKNADYVVCYTKHLQSKTATYKSIAKKQGKTVIELSTN